MAVSPTNGYATGAQLKAALNIPSANTDRDTELTRAIDAASRAIDDHCHRFFYDSGSATARKFTTSDPYVLIVPDFHTTTGLVVATDTTGDGTFDTTWSSSGSPADYQPEPIDPDEGRPWTRLAAIDDKTFPTGGRAPTVQVTAQWGWAAVPDPVTEACIREAAVIFKIVSEGSVPQWTPDVDTPIRNSRFFDATVELLLRPYVRSY